MGGQLRSWVFTGLLVPLTAYAAFSSAQAHTPKRAAPDYLKAQSMQAAQIDWKAVEEALGRSGSMQAGDVYRFSSPRSDLKVMSRGMRIDPALALGTWIAMKPRGKNEVVAMGDLVLTEAEYNRVIPRLQEGEVRQTAIHKHLFETSPAIWWVHIQAQGDPVQIARTLREALALTGTPAQDPARRSLASMPLNTTEISRILGYRGKTSGNIYQVSVPRPETIRAMGIEVPPAMGTATALNFQPTGNGRAVINGDFVMRPDEVQGVIRALKEHDIEVVSLHNHMLDEEPRLFFMHFWANDDALKLARGLRAALDQINTPRATRR